MYWARNGEEELRVEEEERRREEDLEADDGGGAAAAGGGSPVADSGGDAAEEGGGGGAENQTWFDSDVLMLKKVKVSSVDDGRLLQLNIEQIDYAPKPSSVMDDFGLLSISVEEGSKGLGQRGEEDDGKIG
nr:hypothetical protein Iba_chr03aCG10460 [Ipomoea batatas]GMC69875.1 hypothetical protein Iba_chr03aCG10670 [Ipomoea batatas]